jgi:hypothetical protein
MNVAVDLVVEMAVDGVQHQTRRAPRPDLDDPLRAGVTDHAIQEDGVGVRIRGVLIEVAESGGSRVREGQVPIVAGDLAQERQLGGLVQVDSGNGPGRRPEEAVGIPPHLVEGGDRRIKMARRNESEHLAVPLQLLEGSPEGWNEKSQ